MAKLVKMYSQAQAGRIIDARLARFARNGLKGKDALGRLIRPGNIATGFGRNYRETTQTIREITETITGSIVSDVKQAEMLYLSDKVAIMKGLVSVELFKQVMEGYEFRGDDAPKLKAVLTHPEKAGEAVTWASILDAFEFAKRMSQRTGRKFRLPTEAEKKKADKLSIGYDGYHALNNTWSDAVSRFFIKGDARLERDEDLVNWRFSHTAIRLVEDK
ncbi:hypothetical protein ACFL37_00195 [Candidatus Margulisiibacteriota bacterium]